VTFPHKRVGEHLGRVRSPRQSLAALIEQARWVTSAERERLQQTPFYILDCRVRYDPGGAFTAPQVLFVVTSPALWGDERRLLGLASYPARESFARELARELRDVDAVGPWLLTRSSTAAGHEAWRFVSAPEAPAAD
jgi:hypothetical protein